MSFALCLALVQIADAEALREWAAALSSEDTLLRDRAYRRLERAGMAAREALEEVCVGRDPPAARRAEELLAKIGVPLPVHRVALWLALPSPPSSADPFEPPTFRVRIRNLGDEPLTAAFRAEAGAEAARPLIPAAYGKRRNRTMGRSAARPSRQVIFFPSAYVRP